ncbi:MAG: Excinuclease subunit domain protein [Myxococcales bacterium]|nr:Excinuclease subunit domain protein [Myxococcales bacterium]
MGRWFVYLARCADGSLYCGITNDLAARMAAHNAGKGARYTRSRGPIQIAVKRRCSDKSEALQLEYAIKQLSRAEKTALIADRRLIAPLVRMVRARRRA